jgi:hypothetical protein
MRVHTRTFVRMTHSYMQTVFRGGGGGVGGRGGGGVGGL